MDGQSDRAVFPMQEYLISSEEENLKNETKFSMKKITQLICSICKELKNKEMQAEYIFKKPEEQN